MDKIGKYEVLDKIGSGGFAVVYKGYDPFIKRPVAIKVCYSRDEETRQRFFREAEIAGRLVHRNVTTIYDFGLHEQMPYLVEEYLPGEDLAQMVRRHEPEMLEEKLDLLLQIASGLEYAHAQGIIHRDIKPSNVRVLDNGRAKIMDFGTAKLANVESHLTQTGMTLGTVAYLPPERLLGRPGGLNSDLFSFGVMAYEMLSFQRPFNANNIPNLIDAVLHANPAPLPTVWPECPSELGRIVHRCLEKDPEIRYRSCSELLADLTTFHNQHITTVVPVRDETTSSVAVVTPDVQLTGLLERARHLLEKGRLDRASVILEEVLEIAPDNAEALALRDRCRPPAPTPVPKPLFEAADERRSRKINEAVGSIERYLAARELVQAAGALRFAIQLLGQFEQAMPLRERLAAEIRVDASGLRDEARRRAASTLAQLAELQRANRLTPATAEPLVRWIEDLDAGNPGGREILAQLYQAVYQVASDDPGERRSRKRAEAVESIERLLASGKPEMAAKALRFALDLLGEFEEAPLLEARIGEAIRQTAVRA